MTNGVVNYSYNYCAVAKLSRYSTKTKFKMFISHGNNAIVLLKSTGW